MEAFQVHIISMVNNMFDDFYSQTLHLQQRVIHK